MGDSKKDSENWDFKVSDEHLEQVDIKKKPRKASGGAGNIAPSELKKTKKKKKLEVSQVKRKKKMSRTAHAQKATAEERFAALRPPSIAARIFATGVDYGLIALAAAGAFLYQELLYGYLIDFLAQKNISQPYHPDLVKQVLIGCVTFVVTLVFVILPVFVSGKTPGKIMTKTRVDSATLAGEEPSNSKIALREFILKPVSIVSVIGLLMGLKNEGNRCLHDVILGSALFSDD